jgi:type I restriction enzyme S subunit
MSFPRYPAYKPSGVEWLEEVPEHWGVTALKYGYVVTLGKMLQPEAASEEDLLMPYLRAANIRWSGVDDSDIKTMWFSTREREHLRRQVGDLLVSEGGDVGRSALWKGEIIECYFQNSVNRLRPSNGNLTSFLRYWMSTMKDKGFIDVLCNKSTIAHFTAEKVGAVPVPFPPVAEQAAIATFLDLETAKIDALIAEQQRLIELLQEKRQAVISHAVTKGLNPVAPMKDSGVEWLGDVTVHWEVLPAGRACEIFAPQRDKPDLNAIEDGYPWITLENIKNGNLVNPSAWVSIDAARVAGVRPLAAGSVIASCIGNFGIAAVTKEDSAINQQLQAYRPGSAVNAQFLLNAIISSRSYFGSVCTTSTFPYVNKSGFWGLLIALPPKEEQVEIASAISQRVLELDSLLTLSVQATGLLQERRSALISASVTGQIDVRGLVPDAEAV